MKRNVCTGTFWVGLAVAFLLGGCSSPTLEGRLPSYALPAEQAAQTRLGRGAQPLLAQHPGLSGFHPLAAPLEAFGARMLLCRTAEKTLDVQYYIWHGDTTGTLLMAELQAAAERGVRVRLLLDDSGTSGLDDWLAALDSHANIEVRLFNPFAVRSPKSVGYLTHFSRANRRMHNKAMTADNVATIVGGRNVGDEYFGADDQMVFADLDMLGVGPVAAQTSVEFDRYWASASSYPVAAVLPPASEDQQQGLQTRLRQASQVPAATRYVAFVRQLPFIEQLLQGRLDLEWAPAQLISDDPAKGLGAATDERLLTQQMVRILGAPKHNVELVSPYFVPARTGVATLTGLARQGVKVRVLTNALEATDVAAVHSGYARYRKTLLEAGVELYEMRRDSRSDRPRDKAGPFGSSGSSLHAKTFAIDGQRLFVGSFNFDPRSARLNTEQGFIVDSPLLARKVQAVFDEGLRQSAYQVQLSADGELYWLDRRGEQPVRLDSEPGSGLWKRVGVRVMGWLPIEWLL